MKKQAVLVALVFGLALGVTGCATAGPVRPTVTPSAGSNSESSSCGHDVANGPDELLSIGEMIDSTGVKLERSGGGVTQFSADQCGVPIDSPIPSGKCDLADFPWVSSVRHQNRELYSRGVGEIRQATFSRDGQPFLTEFIIKPTGKQMIGTYRKHALSCPGVATVSVNGRVTTFIFEQGTKGAIEISDQAIVALVSRDGKSVDALLPKAVSKLK